MMKKTTPISMLRKSVSVDSRPSVQFDIFTVAFLPKDTIFFNLVQEMKVLKQEEVFQEIICADGVEWKEIDVDELTEDSVGRLVCPQPERGKSFKAPRTLKRHLFAHSLEDSNNKKVPPCPKCRKAKNS
jgi:hypothetical protein